LYTRFWNQFTQFCHKIGYVSSATAVDDLVNVGNILASMPTWIALWIMDKSVANSIY
jgi:hypothetical protein